MFLAPSIKVQPCSEEDFLKVLFNNFSLACWFRSRLLEHYPLALLEGDKSKGRLVASLRDTLGNITQHYSLNYEHFKTAGLEAKGMLKVLTKKGFKTIGHGMT